jgi:hypothetical protein
VKKSRLSTLNRRGGPILLVLILAGCAGWAWVWVHLNCWTPDELNEAIAASLPRGSTRAEAIRWLDSHHFVERRKYLSHVTPADHYGTSGPWGEQFRDGTGTGREGAVCVTVFPCWFKRPGNLAEIHLILFFDKDDKLAGHTVATWEASL